MDTYRKGQDILIRALKILINDGYNVDLTLIGDGKKREEFEKLSHDLEIEKNVSFLGSIKDKQIIFDCLKKSRPRAAFLRFCFIPRRPDRKPAFPKNRCVPLNSRLYIQYIPSLFPFEFCL